MTNTNSLKQPPSVHFQLLGRLVERAPKAITARAVERLVQGMHDHAQPAAFHEIAESWTMVRHNAEWRDAWVNGAQKAHGMQPA